MAYFGGKNGAGVYQTIINYIPPHRTYIELFLGSGTIMRYKRPALENIGIEIDPEVVRSHDYGSCTVKIDCATRFPELV